MAKSGWHLCAFAVSLGIWGLSIMPKRRRALTSELSGHFEARPQLYYCVPCWCSSAGAAMGLIRQFRNLRLLALSTLNQLHRKRPSAKAGGFLEQGNQPCNNSGRSATAVLLKVFINPMPNKTDHLAISQ
jgi:hypothetical protein